MANEFLYMCGVVAVGWGITFGLRALPFLLFGASSRPIPSQISRLSAYVSPVVIAALVVYSYSGLEWRTAWPYLAGVVTVGLQAWRRNSLVSIFAGTAVYMMLLSFCGCTTAARTIELDAKHPAISVKVEGVYFGNEKVPMTDVPKILDDAGIPRDRTIHILLDSQVRDLTEARCLMGVLASAGYQRPILVTKRHAESSKVDPEARNVVVPTNQQRQPVKRKVWYNRKK